MFALSPNTGPPRLLRFISKEQGGLPGRTIATLDKENNVLCIDREKFDQLSTPQQETVIRTHGDMES